MKGDWLGLRLDLLTAQGLNIKALLRLCTSKAIESLEMIYGPGSHSQIVLIHQTSYHGLSTPEPSFTTSAKMKVGPFNVIPLPAVIMVSFACAEHWRDMGGGSHFS